MGEIAKQSIASVEKDTYFAPSIGNILSRLRGECMPQGKSHVRALLEGGVQLSVPLVGGNSILKQHSLNWDKVCISSHGDWQRKHLGAWQAIYGRTPYFIHIFPELEKVYREKSQGLFQDFCGGLNLLINRYLQLDQLQPYANQMKIEQSRRYDAIRNEIASQISPELTVFDAIFRFGPDAAFIFL